ncbi:MAG TPA: CGNR zinc finger domain-containing protein [Streptosporangiaceae bacterium]|nr:CGNR zinc finger domain-containing protein [Streptosporangiaceae bacterium]
MLFAHDTTAALTVATDLVNTSRDGEDFLPDVATLEAFLDEHDVTRGPVGAADLAAVRALRPQLRTVWEATTPEDLAALVNGLLRHARPWVVDHGGGWGWHLHVTEPAAPLADRIGAQSGFAFADLIRLRETERLRVCDAADCSAVLIDLSRNRSRRYCDTGNCGNRQHVAAYRARLRA